MKTLLIAVCLLVGFAVHLSAQVKLYVAPVVVASMDDKRMTVHSWIKAMDRNKCEGIAPTAFQDRADYTVWYERDTNSFALVWDTNGDLIGERGDVRRQGNIVKDVCNIIHDHQAKGAE